MHSLRFKIVVSLLVTSLAAVALVGLVARWLLLQSFGGHIHEDAFNNFRVVATSYVRTYGSVEGATRSEPFGEFQKRWDQRHPSALEARESWSPFREARPAPSELREPVIAPPGPEEGFDASDDLPPDAPPLSGGMPPSPRAGHFPVPPDDGNGERDQPPFRFLLVTPEWKVAGGDSAYAAGSSLPAALRAEAKPIVVSGKTAGWAVPIKTPNLTRQDHAYLDAVKQALLYAVLAAGLLALVVGVVLGNRLSRKLRDLTVAVQAIARGELDQEVQVSGSDEVGILGRAFNSMSAELARTHAELKQSEEQVREQAARLQELSIRDGLTGIHNRRFFDEHCRKLFSQARRYREPLTLALADIDSFKRINDRFSHAVGDEVLRRVAALLSQNLRESDLLARYGGEEFVIAFCHTGADQAVDACEKLRRLVEEQPWHDIHPDLRVTVSIGYCDDPMLPGMEQLLGAADAALYRAKEEGRNQVRGNRLSLPADASAIRS